MVGWVPKSGESPSLGLDDQKLVKESSSVQLSNHFIKNTW